MKNWIINEDEKTIQFLFEVDGIAEDENGNPDSAAASFKINYNKLPDELEMREVVNSCVACKAFPGFEGHQLRPITAEEFAAYDED